MKRKIKSNKKNFHRVYQDPVIESQYREEKTKKYQQLKIKFL